MREWKPDHVQSEKSGCLLDGGTTRVHPVDRRPLTPVSGKRPNLLLQSLLVDSVSTDPRRGSDDRKPS